MIGPNGAGKSTLLRTLSGILRHQEGAVWLEGSDLSSMAARDVAAMLALVPQIAPYTQGFTAFELVLMGRYPHLGRFEVEGQADDRIAEKAMRLTETEEFATRTLETLSGWRAPARVPRAGAGAAAPHPATGRADLEPGHPAPAHHPRAGAAARRRRADGHRGPSTT